MPETRGDVFIRRVVGYIPRPLAAAPERVLINFCCAIIGLSWMFGAHPGSLLELWPQWVVMEESLAFAIGGICALVGYWRANRSVERLGYMLIGFAATIYGVGVVVVFGWDGIGSGVIFLGIACSKLIRLLVGSAVRSAIIRAGRHPHGWKP